MALRHLCVWVYCGLMVAGCQSETVSAPDVHARQVHPERQALIRTPAVQATAVNLPPSDRVFCLDLDGDGSDEVLGAHGSDLWAARIDRKAVKLLWKQSGKGVVHRLAIGQIGTERTLVIARGIGRGPNLKAPLSLSVWTARSKEPKMLWSNAGVRNEPAHLSIQDLNGDGQSQVAFAHYVDKYHVATRHMNANGIGQLGEKMRMASGRIYADINADGRVDEVISRVYGDAKGLPGDLKINLGQGWVTVSTDNGVRGLVFAHVKGAKPAVFFADGWRSNYGKEAKAQVKTLEWTPMGPKLTKVGDSPGEFTFFELWAVDIDGDGFDELVARGNRHITLFSKADTTVWSQTKLATFEPVINVAFGLGGDGHWRTFVPGKTKTNAILAQVKPKAAQ